VIAISTDDAETQKKFRESLKAPYHFVADEKATLVKLFDVKVFLLTMSKRITFVVGPGRKILSIQEGSDAIDPSGAVAACSIKPPESLKYLTGDADAGALEKK
jgi:peroxiredoxin